MTGSALPLILVVSGEQGLREGLTRDIARRFGADYTVAAAHTTDACVNTDHGVDEICQQGTGLVLPAGSGSTSASVWVEVTEWQICDGSRP